MPRNIIRQLLLWCDYYVLICSYKDEDGCDIIRQFNPTGPPLFTWPVVDGNILEWHVTILLRNQKLCQLNLNYIFVCSYHLYIDFALMGRIPFKLTAA